ncbi:hypothetical protein ACLQ2S_24710 [Micromonospora sp. DT48]|uniref:hypothetical protein n=1 Tax=Micromonospora sp. DT48 TaxID=3393429 RepID=UPI003CEAFABA
MRENTPPADRLDYDDRHETRATNDDATLRRYIKLGWHKVAMRLGTFAGVMLLYLCAVVVALWLIPNATPQEAMKIAGAAVAAGSGGLAINALLGRVHRRRRRW